MQAITREDSRLHMAASPKASNCRRGLAGPRGRGHAKDNLRGSPSTKRLPTAIICGGVLLARGVRPERERFFRYQSAGLRGGNTPSRCCHARDYKPMRSCCSGTKEREHHKSYGATPLHLLRSNTEVVNFYWHTGPTLTRRVSLQQHGRNCRCITPSLTPRRQ